MRQDQKLRVIVGFLIAGSTYLFSASTRCQPPKPPLAQVAAPHVVWKDVFGFNRATPNITYCLMGNGFILAPTSANFGHLVSLWLLKHPRAKVIPVASFSPVMVDQPKSEQIYAWVVDDKDNLNEYLVQQGACPGDTMQIPYYPLEEHEKGYSKPLVLQAEYNIFMKKIVKAEAAAQKGKVGIWKHGTNVDGHDYAI